MVLSNCKKILKTTRIFYFNISHCHALFVRGPNLPRLATFSGLCYAPTTIKILTWRYFANSEFSYFIWDLNQICLNFVSKNLVVHQVSLFMKNGGYCVTMTLKNYSKKLDTALKLNSTRYSVQSNYLYSNRLPFFSKMFVGILQFNIIRFISGMFLHKILKQKLNIISFVDNYILLKSRAGWKFAII